MHYFQNFKSFVDGSLDLIRPVTLLIGKNGSGKTNAIEAVELLAQLAHGLPLFEVSDLGRGSRSYEVRGGLRDCVRFGAESFKLGFKAIYTKIGEAEGVPIDYCIEIAAAAEPRICSEILAFGDRVLFDARISSNAEILDVEYHSFAGGRHKPQTQISSDRSALSRYQSFYINAPNKGKEKRVDAIGVVNALEGYLTAAFVFDPNARAMRSYEHIGQPMLRRDGSNLSAVLYNLKTGGDEQQATLSRIIERLQHLPEEPFKEFDFVVTTQNDVLIALKRQDESIVDARVISDGTLRALAILTALETVPEFSRIVIEEIDNGIHPSRVKVLLDALWETSKRRNLNVLVTTHNPSSLNALDIDQLRNVVICTHDPGTRSSSLIPLPELPRAEGLLLNGLLGDLVSKDALQKYLESNFEEEHKKKMSDWLKSL